MRRTRHRSGTARPLAFLQPLISIAITGEAYEAIKTTLLGTADAPTRAGPDGLIRIWLDPKFVDRLGQMRGPGESYSEVILRMAKA